MSKSNGAGAPPRKFKSPLARWPGHFTLKEPDDFTGDDWNLWRRAVDKAPDDTLNRLYCYAGLDLIEALGEWKMEIPMAEVRAWATHPADERMKLVGWIGKTVEGYIGELINPKE